MLMKYCLRMLAVVDDVAAPGSITASDAPPAVLDVDKDTRKAILLRESPAAELHEKVRAAAKCCPTMAIQVED